MAQKHRNNQNRKRSQRAPSHQPAPSPRIVYERKAPVSYGLPIVLLEDLERKTFEFKAGSWVPHGPTIAECRANQCQVKQLAQKLNNMTRYEVRYPIAAGN